MISLVFKLGGGLEDRMISEVFLLMILWEEKSKVLLGPDVSRWNRRQVIDVRKISFNAGRNWETDEEMCSCEFLLSTSALEFKDLSLNTQVVELDLEFFKWVDFDSNKDWNDDVHSE